MSRFFGLACSPSPLFKKVIQEVANNTQSPPELVLFSDLAAHLVHSQGLYSVETPSNKKVGSTGLMLMAVASSGERKTTVDSCFFQTIRSLEAERGQQHLNNGTKWAIKGRRK
jgi:hypothetical protein